MTDTRAMKAAKEIIVSIRKYKNLHTLLLEIESSEHLEKLMTLIIEKHQQPSVFALEAENVGLREALAGFLNWSSGHGHYELNTLRREGLDILNREQEKP